MPLRVCPFGESLGCVGCHPGSLHMVHCLPSAVQIFLTLMLLSSILTLFFWYTMPELKGKHHYTGEKHVHSLATETILIFWAFLILFSVMVPMAMFVL